MENYKKYRHQIVYNDRFVSNWFSNMLPSPFTPIPENNITYKTVEHFYQAMKSNNTLEHALIATCTTPYEAKRLGKTVKDQFQYILDDFPDIISSIDEARLYVMKIGLIQKFEIPEWKEKLLNIRPNEPIIEWNNWNDKFWGVSVKDNQGENNLGKLIMDIRLKLK